MLRTLKSLLAALAFFVIPAAAHAEEPTRSYPDCGREPTDAEVAAAKGAFQAGNASFNEADYARAIDYWEDAYRRDCTANPLLLNLARAYELAGRKRQAVVSLETFLAREPGSGEKDQINRRIEVLKKKIAEEDAAAAAAPPTPPPPPPAGPVAPPAPQPDRAHASPWPWVVMGAGGVVTAIGIVGVVVNNRKVNDFEERCPNRKCGIVDPITMKVTPDVATASAAEDARVALNRSVAITGVGVALIAGGGVWYYLDRRAVAASQAHRPRVLPVVGPQLAGLAVSGVF